MQESTILLSQCPPQQLSLGVTLVGTLIRSVPHAGLETFILNRTAPSALKSDLPSTFFPADGCVDVQWTKEHVTLKATCRYYHELSETGVVVHRSEPFDDSSDGKSWLFDAIRIPWSLSQKKK